MSLAHLSPFVRISEEKIRRDLVIEWNENGFIYNEQQLEKIVQRRLKEEVKGGIQTIQYQINTLQTSNGQSPFLSVFM